MHPGSRCATRSFERRTGLRTLRIRADRPAEPEKRLLAPTIAWAARSSTELDAAVLEDGLALPVLRLESEGAPSICQTRVVTDSPGNSGAEKRTAIRVTVTRVVDARGLQNARPANAIVQSPWTIRPGRPDLPCELVVEMDREVVARAAA